MILGMEIRDRVVDYVQKRIAKLRKDNPGTGHKAHTYTTHHHAPWSIVRDLPLINRCRPVQEHRLRPGQRHEALAELV